MASTHRLSTDQVAALVDGLRGLDAEGTGDGAAAVQPYRFGTDNRAMLGDTYGLRMINERFCRLARPVFLPFLRMHPRISSFPPEIKTFEQYANELDNFTSLTISRMEPLRGTTMITLHPDFVSLLTDAYYGGAIRHQPNRRTEFTTTENRVIELVTTGLNRALEAAWRDLAPLSFHVASHEENLQFATFVEGRDLVVNCSFIIQLPDTDPANLDILYPLQALKPLAAQLRSRMQSDVVDDDATWRARLARAVMAVPLTVTARLAEPQVPLGALDRRAPGQMLPVDLAPAPVLMVADKPLFAGEIGAANGHAAISLTRRLGR
jgi:flagellar motor switch protein FliM